MERDHAAAFIGVTVGVVALGGGRPLAAHRRLRLVSALETAPELDRLALDQCFEAILLWFRQRREEPGHVQELRLAQPLQLQLCGFEHRTGTLHGEVQGL